MPNRRKPSAPARRENPIEKEARILRGRHLYLTVPHPRLNSSEGPCLHVRFSGTACTKRAHTYSCFCDQHGPVHYSMKVAPSRIPGAGLGLFAIKHFAEGDTIDYYIGTVYAMESDHQGDYTFDVRGQYIVDAIATQSCLSRYINHSSLEPNCVFKVYGRGEYPHIVVQATRDIMPGEELLIDYGPSYFRGARQAIA